MGENRSGLPGEIGQNGSELVKTGGKLGQIGRNVPRNTTIPREEASKSRKFFDKKKAPWWDA